MNKPAIIDQIVPGTSVVWGVYPSLHGVVVSVVEGWRWEIRWTDLRYAEHWTIHADYYDMYHYVSPIDLYCPT